MAAWKSMADPFLGQSTHLEFLLKTEPKETQVVLFIEWITCYQAHTPTLYSSKKA